MPYSKSFISFLVLYICFFRTLSGQCPKGGWSANNIGNAYVEATGSKSFFNDFNNSRSAQFVNDGHLSFFGDITNNGYYGDGFGYEYILSCDNKTTTISGIGVTEFNILELDNRGNVDLNTDIRIKTNLQFTNGIIHTDRSKFAERVFFLEGASHGGATNQNHINGTVARQGQEPFIFPLGDGDHLGRLKIRGTTSFDIYMASYYSTNLDESQWIAPGRFPVDKKDYNIGQVQDNEFWTIVGGQSTTITLFWTPFSNISRIAKNLDDLIVVGWDGEKWVNLGNVDVQEAFGTGSVSSSPVVPNRYEAFTFASLDTDGDGIADSEDPNANDPCNPNSFSPVCTSGSCIDVQISVFLEGSLQRNQIDEYNDEMYNGLNRFGYLPGQKPLTLFGTSTPAGQPYQDAPFYYEGLEGHQYNYQNENHVEYSHGVIDWVLVSFRSDIHHESTVCQKVGLLTRKGEVIFAEFFDCCDMEGGAFYIVVEHRNHLPVMSPIKVALSDNLLSYDFRKSDSYRRLLGHGQKEVHPGVFAMYAGNGDQTIFGESPTDINAIDVAVWSMGNGLHSGYYVQDFDLNGDVNVHDKSIWLQNNGIFTDVDQ